MRQSDSCLNPAFETDMVRSESFEIPPCESFMVRSDSDLLINQSYKSNQSTCYLQLK